MSRYSWPLAVFPGGVVDLSTLPEFPPSGSVADQRAQVEQARRHHAAADAQEAA